MPTSNGKDGVIPLNIAHVVSYPYHGGTQEYSTGLARSQARLGHNAIIYTAGEGVPNFSDLRIRLEKPQITLFRNPISFNLVSALMRNQADYHVLHLHLPFPITGDSVALFARLFRVARSKALVVTYHFDIDLESIGERALALIYSNTVLDSVLSSVDRIIVTSMTFKQNSFLLRRHEPRVVVIPIGIDTGRYATCYDDSSKIVFVGRIIPEKGIHYLMQALKYLDSKTELIIVGKVIERYYYRYLLHLSEKLNLEKRIVFTGYVPQSELLKLYQKAGVVVLPSTTRLETFGTTLLEAMASGKPIVATNVIPGAVELIRKSRCGLVVPPRNPAALAEAVEAARADSQHMGRRGRKYAEDNHDWGQVSRKVVMLYDKIITEKCKAD